MISASELTAKIKSYNPEVKESFIKKAYAFAKSGHGNQKRHSGEIYFSHPLAVAEILIELKMDEDTVVAALLHDIVEDTDITLDEIDKEFGQCVANLVDGVTKLGKLESSSVNEAVAENFRKLTLAMSRDIRVLLIKLADRLHNMRTLFYVPSRQKKVKKAQESLAIYAPLAARIGLNKIKEEMQEIAFAITEPKNHSFIINKLNNLVEKKKNFIDKVIQEISSKLKKEKIDFEISGRQKTPYSIFNKMKVRNIGFHHLYDIMAFRIIVDDIGECYRVLGLINSTYRMIPSTFRDYISTPKDNGYRSLHLAILGPFNKKIEIQIRDKMMHEEAELGLAAHWSYKDNFGKKSKAKNEDKAKNENQQYQWIRDLISLFENSQNAQDVLASSNLEAHKDEVFCFTPNGDIFNLPLGSTAVDFAYAIHSEIGNSCVSVKINSVICPLRQKLENGDQVEIVTDKNANPSPNWLQFVITPKAKSSIKAFIRSEKSEEHKKLGHGILNNFFATKNKKLQEELLEKVLPNFNIKKISDLYSGIAQGAIARYDVLRAVYPDMKKEKRSENDKVFAHNLPVKGLIAGMEINFAGCCNSIPGDPIVGVLNTGIGVSIHHQECNNLKNLALDPKSIIDISWKNKQDEKLNYLCKVKVVLANKNNSLTELIKIILATKTNIDSLKIRNRNLNFFEAHLKLQVKDSLQIEDVLSDLILSKKIIEANRVCND